MKSIKVHQCKMYWHHFSPPLQQLHLDSSSGMFSLVTYLSVYLSMSLYVVTSMFYCSKMFEYSKPREEYFNKDSPLKRSYPSLEGTRSRSSSNLEDNIDTVLEMRKKFYEWMFPVRFHFLSTETCVIVILAQSLPRDLLVSQIVTVLLSLRWMDRISSLDYWCRGNSDCIWTQF